MNDSYDRAQHPLAGPAATLCAEAAETVAAAERPPGEGPGSAAILAEIAHMARTVTTVVVAGEQKRGKSTLINALLAVRDLLPEDADVATTTHATVRYAAEPTAVAWPSGADTPVPIGIAGIAEFAAADPETGEVRHPDIVGLEIGYPAAVLATGLELVDTPGVGGLDSGHGRVTMAALSRADVLVFVVNGAHELTASELAFLTGATERIDTVLFVLAQTDKYPAWPRLLERNRKLVAAHARRYAGAPWFPVSSRAELDAVDARTAGDDGRAAQRAAESGFAPLTAALASIADRGREIRLDNGLYVARREVEALLARSRRGIGLLERDPVVEAEAADLSRQLAEVEAADAAWRTTLRRRTGELTDQLQLAFDRSITDLRNLMDKRVAEQDPHLLDALPKEIEAAVTGLWLDLDTVAGRGVAQIVDEIGRDFGDSGLAGISANLTLPERLRDLPAVVASEHDGRGLMAHLERFGPALRTGGLTTTMLAALTTGAAIPVLAGLAVTATMMFRRARREHTMRITADANRHISRIIGLAQVEVPSEFRRAVENVRVSVAEHVSVLIAAERAQLTADVADRQRLLETEDRRLAQRRETLDTAIATCRGLIERIDGLRIRLATGDGHAG
ncbi:dynamin family protein [Micromonospora sp. WMMD730]|uniref:dynamin family protein n=1 Tax=Micromonospora sp. WMMD730 TaxID=3404128 RepID=UPI003B964F1D